MSRISRVVQLACVALFLTSCATPTAPPPQLPASTAPTPTAVSPPIAPTLEGRTWIYSSTVGRTDCPSFYVEAAPPIVQTDHDMLETREFCYTHFSVLHSTQTIGALWSATYLTPEMSRRGDCIARGGYSFRVQQGVARSGRASARDYRGFGHLWEIGHMTPANDMPTYEAQRETFVFSNAIPQAADFNGEEWAELEIRIHNLAQDAPNGLYIVTGSIFAGDTIERLNGRVGIPTHVFKAIYDPARERAVVFLASNIDDPVIEQMSVSDFQRIFGVQAFPGLADGVLDTFTEWHLPSPRHRACSQN